jgi:hypothetical protein
MSKAPRTRKVKTDYVITIPTFQRVNTFYKKTYSRIIKPYKLESRVLLLIQTDDDAKQYKERMPELKQLRTPCGLFATMNFIAQYFAMNTPLLIMHDDLTRLLYVKPPSAKRITVRNADVLFRKVFLLMKINGCNLGGLYPTNYPLSMVTQPAMTTDLRFIHDPLTFIYNQKIMMNPQFTHHKMDFQRTIEYYKHDEKVLRYNHYTFCTAYNPKTNEGGFGYRTAEKEKEVCDIFMKKYSSFISRIVTHKDGSTSLVLRRNPENLTVND